jgi:acyl carrier protein
MWVWSELLQRGDVTVHDNFFELGGNSLSAVRAVTRIRSLLAIDFELTAIFDAPTIARLAKLCESMQVDDDRLNRALQLMEAIAREGERAHGT